MALFDFNALPGLGSAVENAERTFLWGKHEQVLFRSGVILSTSTDKGNSPNTTLRAGLVLAQLSTNKWVPYSSTATDGSQVAAGVLAQDVKMLGLDGTVADRVCVVVVGGPLKGGQLLYNAPVSTATLSGLDQQGRAQLYKCTFDDDLPGNKYQWESWIPKTADYTLVSTTDNHTVFTNAGASGVVKFTLPALLDGSSNPVCKGVAFRVVVEADQDVWLSAAGSDNLIVFNNAAAATVKVDQTNKRIGTVLTVETNAAGTKWVVTMASNLWANLTIV